MSKEIQKGKVLAVSLSQSHTFSKERQDLISLVKGFGVKGDAHYGETVQHRSRVAKNPNQPNLRQVHLIQNELLEELADRFTVEPGQMGENITTNGIDLLELPVDTKLHIGESAIVQITGLRNPCSQIDAFQAGLLKAVVDKDSDGNVIRKAGIMGVVLQSGDVKPGDSIVVEWPSEPFQKLERV